MRRGDGDRSRRTLSVVWLLVGLMFTSRALVDGQPVPTSVLPPANLVGGQLMVTLLFFYPIEVIRPGWLNAKRSFGLLLPTFLIGMACHLLEVKFSHLRSFDDMLAHIGEPDVYGRLLLLFGVILPSALLLHVVPYNWMKSRVHLSWIRHYTYTILLISALYTVFMLTRNTLVSMTHLMVCLSLALIVTYEELFTRISLPQGVPLRTGRRAGCARLAAIETDSPLALRLSRLFKEEEVWQNPDLTVVALAQMLGTNRSYLAHAIQEAGYTNFADLINRHRVQAFCRLAEEGKVDSVQDAFSHVGFRPKETALRSFKKYTGFLPSEYLMTVAAKRPKTPELPN